MIAPICRAAVRPSGVRVPALALGDLRPSLQALPAPPCQVTGHLLFPQMETHSWLLPPWTRCWRVSRGPGVPPAPQVSAEGSSTEWPGLGVLSCTSPGPRGLKGPQGDLGSHGLGRVLETRSAPATAWQLSCGTGHRSPKL